MKVTIELLIVITIILLTVSLWEELCGFISG